MRSMRARLGYYYLLGAVVVGDSSSEPFGSLRNDYDGSNVNARRLLRARIFGGEPASDGEYPSYAIPKIFLFGILCGSVQIWNDILLSAGHCGGSFRGKNAVIGTHHLDGSGAIETIPAVAEMIHPQFDEVSLENDFMLVKLQRASSAPNMPWNADPLAPQPGESVQIIGFGQTERASSSQELLKASVAIVDYETCRQVYGSLVQDDIMICASRMNTDTCAGDRYVGCLLHNYYVSTRYLSHRLPISHFFTSSTFATPSKVVAR